MFVLQRGGKYLPNPAKKKYTREQVANGLLLNDLRDILSLEEVSHLLGYVNESLLDTSDDRINPTKLYGYYSEIFDCSQKDWEKVATTLVILNLLARANLYKQIAKRWLKGLED